MVNFPIKETKYFGPYLFCMMVFSLFFTIIHPVTAQDVGTTECAVAQLDALEAASNATHKKEHPKGKVRPLHGKMVSAASNFVSERVDDGFITEGCADCIMSDIATKDKPFESCGPICGDGILEEDVEACDDGNNVGSDGCDEFCQVE